MQLGRNSISQLLRWWFYQHGLYCAKHPRTAAVIGITVVMLSSLALFNPRGQPFVFEFQKIMQDFFRFIKHYAMPKWNLLAYLAVALYVAWCTDKGVKYSILKHLRSTLGLTTTDAKTTKQKRKPLPWSPPFAARFTIGFCGVLTLLLSIVLACAVANSLLGVSMESVLDEFPFLVLYMGPQSVYSLLGASTLTYTQSEYCNGGQVFVVDRVKQIAMATSLTGPEEVLTSLSKAALALTVLWPLASGLGEWLEPVAHLCVHAGLAVLFKCLLQMSVLASIVQALVPFWDPADKAEAERPPEVKCRICLESSDDLRRCPCRCSGSVGYIHPVCFQQWYETKKSLRCELCHALFQVRMLPSSVTTNIQTMESFLLELLPPLCSRLALYLLLLLALGCNKLGLLLVDATARRLQASLRLPSDLSASLLACALLASPALLAALGVVPEVLAEWHRRHRTMQWIRRRSFSEEGDDASETSDTDSLASRSCPPSPEQHPTKGARREVQVREDGGKGGEERRQGIEERGKCVAVHCRHG